MFYACKERFDADDGGRWLKYLQWLGRADLRRIVSLDSMLCRTLVRFESDADWEFVVCEDFMLDFFTDLEFVLRRASSFPRSMVLAAVREPSHEDMSSFHHPDFEFAGFDIVDRESSISALLNCGGFPEVFSLTELSPASGLIPSLDRAFGIRDRLRELYPTERHADCHVWALWLRI